MAVDSTAEDVDSDFLFQRLANMQIEDELKEAFRYEFSTYLYHYIRKMGS